MGHACVSQQLLLSWCLSLSLQLSKFTVFKDKGFEKNGSNQWETWFVMLEAHDFISYMADKLLSAVIFMNAVSEIASKWIPFYDFCCAPKEPATQTVG